jgi:hexosaminidase
VNRRRIRFFAGLLTAIVIFSLHAALANRTNPPISLSWRLLENRPEGSFRAELRLTNSGNTALENDWILYFNSAAKLLPESVEPDFKLTHINGDFYSLSPTPSAKPLATGALHGIPYIGAPWAINFSDAPAGFYLVRKNATGNVAEPEPLPLEVAAFPDPSKLRRGSADIFPRATSESRYLENESLTLLPADTLIKVVPTPFEIQPLHQRFILDASFTIAPDSATAKEAAFLATALTDVLTGKVTVEKASTDAKAAPNRIRLGIGGVKMGDEAKHRGDEAYVLTIHPATGIEIVGTDPAGVFYGIQTLRALIPVAAYRQPAERIELDAVHIADAPRYHYRGLHLDVARNFQSKQTVMKLLDLMAFYKLNRFHWHLTDDEGWRFEVKQLPELTSVGSRRGHTLEESDRLIPAYGSGPAADAAKSSGTGFYTQEDVLAILQFAHARHIVVIPELDFPGHARAAIKSMEARRNRLAPTDPKADAFLLRDPNDESVYESVQMWRDNVVDVGSESTYRFLDVVFGELADMYKRAGVPLTSIHLGGDEVPAGVWEMSPACVSIPIDTNSKIPRRGQLELHFLSRAANLLAARKIQPACWEDCLLLEVDENKSAAEYRRAAGRPVPTAYVWNNVWGWGREDAAYRLANAGFDVVLCNATHLYCDLAYEKDPLEPGYYWAGFVDVKKPFEFVPPDVFKNADRNTMGLPVNANSLADRVRPTAEGLRHIIGIQGLLWAENLRSPERLEYMAFPRLICLAERAWAQSPAWASTGDASKRKSLIAKDWNQFANRLGQRELPRLDNLDGGVRYRLPPPGAIVRDEQVFANVAFPGLEIRYTTDGAEPTKISPVYSKPLPAKADIKLKNFDTRGRGSRTTEVKGPSTDKQ